jgi:hypothetical protein
MRELRSLSEVALKAANAGEKVESIRLFRLIAHNIISERRFKYEG